jgi:hypothetical protein
VGFELTIPAFERVKTVHALDISATVIGSFVVTLCLQNVNSTGKGITFKAHVIASD